MIIQEEESRHFENGYNLSLDFLSSCCTKLLFNILREVGVVLEVSILGPLTLVKRSIIHQPQIELQQLHYIQPALENGPIDWFVEMRKCNNLNPCSQRRAKHNCT